VQRRLTPSQFIPFAVDASHEKAHCTRKNRRLVVVAPQPSLGTLAFL
jgi:hypothetical protein